MRDPIETVVAPPRTLSPTPSSVTPRSSPVWSRVLLWTGTSLLTALFLLIGGAKLLSSEAARQQFAHWGYPPWFMYANGVVETACALMLLVPRVALLGALIIIGDMIGAIATHAAHREFAMLPVPLVVLVIAALIVRARWSAAYRRR